MSKDGWLSVVECHLCKSTTLTKETHIILVDYDYFGTKGVVSVDICKECYREKKLKELGIN